MAEHGLARALGWVHEGSALLHKRLDELGDAAAEGASLLPGWSRAHVLTHLARNADALVNLLTWARTGVETPMYPDPASRLDDIEQGARRPAPVVLADVLDADARLLAAVDALPAKAWQATVRSALGRTVPASEVPWMRTREVWVHLVDLGAGDDTDAFPDDLVDALLAEVSATVGAKEDCPAVLLRPTDRDGAAYRLGPDGSVPEVVAAPAAGLCAWLLGRDTQAARAARGTTRAVLPRWL
ncbi:maleylpyruvate isomerase family mycothiol-dependent enzyme [Streptomyces sp. NPDC001514]